ncbi:MAG: hypothetical protein NTY70_05210, partial [Burkholderiales bacterium]|nr:hypothetical protein [Burkholderiales bacterium]
EKDWLALGQPIQQKGQAVQAEIARLNSLDLQLAEIHLELLSCLGSEPSTALAELACSAPEFSGRSASKK